MGVMKQWAVFTVRKMSWEGCPKEYSTLCVLH